MKLAEIIIENERNKQKEKSRQLVLSRLKEMVYAFPKEVLQVLHRTGVPVSTLLPTPVLYAVVVKNVQQNLELRDAVAKMLIEMDGFASADGTVMSIVASSLTAVGSVLAGIGRSQQQETEAKTTTKENELQKQLEAQEAQANRKFWLTVGIGAVILIGVLISFSVFGKPKAQLKVA